MLQAFGHNEEGKRLVAVGLSRVNVMLLRSGQPLCVPLKGFGPEEDRSLFLAHRHDDGDFDLPQPAKGYGIALNDDALRMLDEEAFSISAAEMHVLIFYAERENQLRSKLDSLVSDDVLLNVIER